MIETFIGTILAFGFSFAPVGWAVCNGAVLSIASNEALYALLGTNFGGDGRSTFGLPDLRGRVVVGQGQAPGLSQYYLGNEGGQEYVTLAVQNMPSHSHASSFTGASTTVKVSTKQGLSGTPGSRNPVLAGSATDSIYNNETPDFALNIGGGEVTGNISIEDTGGSQYHENRQPYTVLNYCIALQGIFPSRS